MIDLIAFQISAVHLQTFIRAIHSGYAFGVCMQAIHSGYAFRLCIQAMHSGYSLRLFTQAGNSGYSFRLFIHSGYGAGCKSNFEKMPETMPKEPV